MALGAPLHCWTGGSRKFLAFACPHPLCFLLPGMLDRKDWGPPRSEDAGNHRPGLCAARSSPCRTRSKVPQSRGRPRRHKPPPDRKRSPGRKDDQEVTRCTAQEQKPQKTPRRCWPERQTDSHTKENNTSLVRSFFWTLFKV